VKTYTRKEFFKVATATGITFFLAACGISNKKKEKETSAQVPDSSKKVIPEKVPSTNLDLVDKKDPRYETLRKGFNKRFDKYPAIIALCSSTEEVAAAIRYGHEKSLPIAIKSGGHSTEGFSVNDGGMVINLSKLNKVEILDGGKIKVGPGCTLSDLNDTILPQGRLLPAGSCATVGIGGLTLGGGYGLFSRKFGLTCDHMIEATMVDGQGNIHSTKDDDELLWALRGGGAGNFGVITEMIFNTHPAPTVMQGHYFKARKLTAEKAASILQTWMELCTQLPDSCLSGYVLNGSTLNIIITNYEPANDSKLQPLITKLAAVTDESKSSHWGKLAIMLKNHYGSDKPVNLRNSSAGLYKGYNDISSCITQVLEKVITTPGMIYQVDTLGGKVDDEEFKKLSSYPHRGFDFLSELQAYWDTPAQEKRLADSTTHILKIIQQNGITRQYVNYCSIEFNDWENAYYGENYKRLQAVKQKYDPDNNIRHPQSIKA
jgi:hypothetical protein